MKVFFLTAFLYVFPLCVFSQHSQYVKEKKYSGYIFPICHDFFVGNQCHSFRFQPDELTIDSFELKLENEISNFDIPIQEKGCPDIEKKLKKYIRQYLGYLENGNRILYVNFIWSKTDKSILEDLDKKYIEVLGGCSYYWKIKYNIDKDFFFDLTINMSD